MAILEQYRQFGGAHPVTATLTNVLAAEGAIAPHTGRPFSEAMIFGVGGGLGLGYILWEFKAHATANIVLGFRNRWNYPVDYLTQACERLGIRPEFHETGGGKTAAETLADLLAAGRPCLLWVDKAHLPYLYLPASLQGYVSHVIGVCGDDPQVGTILVDDQSGGRSPSPRPPWPMPGRASGRTGTASWRFARRTVRSTWRRRFGRASRIASSTWGARPSRSHCRSLPSGRA